VGYINFAIFCQVAAKVVAVFPSRKKTVPREKLSHPENMLPAAVAAIGVPYTSLAVKYSIPLKFAVATLCAMLTRDLFAIANFLVVFNYLRQGGCVIGAVCMSFSLSVCHSVTKN